MEYAQFVAAFTRLVPAKQIDVLVNYAHRVSAVAHADFFSDTDPSAKARRLWELSQVQSRVIEHVAKLLARDEQRLPDHILIPQAVRGCDGNLCTEFCAALGRHVRHLPDFFRNGPIMHKEARRIFELAWAAFERHPIYPKLLAPVSREGMIRSGLTQHEWNWIVTVARRALRSNDIIARIWIDGCDNCDVRIEPGWTDGTPPDQVSQ